MAIVVTDPETGQSYALYVDPVTGESASTPITAAQAASATASSNVDEYGSAARTIDFNPYTAQVVTDRPAIADVPKELASNPVFQDVNANTAGGLARAYGDIKAGNAQVFQGDNNIPMVYLGGTNQAYELIPSGTPGQYSIYVGAGQVGRGDGYKVPITVDAKGNVQMPEQAITGGGIQYVGSGGGGWDFGEVLSDFGNTLKDAAPYLAAGYLGTQVLPGLLSGAGAGGASAAALDAEFIAADALQLAGQGLAPAAIEQNLIAAGVDSLVAADAAQLALQGIGQGQLANLLVQSGGGGAGTLFTGAGLAGTAGGAGAAGAATQAGTSTGSATGAGAAGAAGSALTGSALAKLAGGLFAGGALTGGMGGGGNVTLPTPSNRAGVSTGSADFSPEYYQQLQQYYNAYMPTQPKDVATPLQQWYETEFTPDANVTNKLFGV
jgi:hypothetical protein